MVARQREFWAKHQKTAIRTRWAMRVVQTSNDFFYTADVPCDMSDRKENIF